MPLAYQGLVRVRWILLAMVALVLGMPALGRADPGTSARAGMLSRVRALQSNPRLQSLQRNSRLQRLRSKPRVHKSQRTKPAVSRAQRLRQRLLRQDLRSKKAAPASNSHARLLDTSSKALGARIDLLSGARKEINLSSYIFTNDAVGRMVVAKLSSAAQRGVKVRLLIDSMGNRMPKEALRHLIDNGVEVALYNKPRFGGLSSISNRMHDKLVLVDGTSMIVGGRNTEAGYFGLKDGDAARWVDVDVHVEGAAAADANQYFGKLWTSSHVTQLMPGDVPVNDVARNTFAQRIAASNRALSGKSAMRLSQAWKEKDKSALANVNFVHDGPTRIGNGNRRTRKALIEMLDAANREVEIQTPFLIPNRSLTAAVKRAVKRGVNVRFITNAKSGKHGALAAYAYEARFHRLVEAGAELWEFTGATSLHSKTAVIDQQRIYIGSHNIDPRSDTLNKEVGIVAESKEIARDLLKHGQAQRQKSLLVAKDGKVLLAKSKTCGAACRFFARAIYGPFISMTGLAGHL